MPSKKSRPQAYPLYSTTFAIHRLSPLYHGVASLHNINLQEYASRFRDILVGDVLRGVRIGLGAEDESLARIGALQNVQWKLLKPEEDWLPGGDDTQLLDDTTTMLQGSRGLHVEVTYEKATYTAILLHSQEGPVLEKETHFLSYPLLLTRMPGSLRETFVNFLATTFDARASVLRLPPQFLIAALEKYLVDITTDETGNQDVTSANHALKTIIKDILITLAFDVPDGSSLKTIDITITKDHIWRMMSRGQRIDTGEEPKAFSAALSHYLDGHLAIDLGNEHVTISKIACGAFVLGVDGRVKLFESIENGDDHRQGKGTQVLVASLVNFAKAGRLTKRS